jgi:alpha/beta superfamily hydrolase
MRKRIIFIVIIIVALIATFGYLERVPVFRFLTVLMEKMGYSALRVQTKEVEFLSGNLQLRGSLYTPGPFIYKFPTIVICHGGTRLGRRLAMYVVVAQELAKRGYVVLTFDFRGIGDSENPHRFETFADLDFGQDISAALTYLSGLKQVDPSQFYVVGHSFGAGVAVMSGIRDFRVKRVVSISPGRNTKQRFFGKDAPDPDWPSRRMSEDMDIHPPIPRAIFDPHLKDYVAEAILDYPVHPPVLLVDGAYEDKEDLIFLKDVAEKMTEPKGYVTIQAADHYFGTKRDQDGSSGAIRYNITVMNALVTAIDQWFRGKTSVNP